jgi:hypothetical protein
MPLPNRLARYRREGLSAVCWRRPAPTSETLPADVMTPASESWWDFSLSGFGGGAAGRPTGRILSDPALTEPSSAFAQVHVRRY